MIAFDLVADRFGLFLSTLFVFIGLMSFLYALATIREKGHRLEYYIMLFLIVGAGVGVSLSFNLLFIFVLWEISTFATWRAVGYYRQTENLRSADVTFLVNFGAAAIMLIGLIILYLDNGTFNLMNIVVYNNIAVVLILIGILAKSVTIPLHIWLVPAYKSIPSAIGGSLAGIAENIGVILFFRLFTISTYTLPQFYTSVAWIAVSSSIILGGAALLSKNLRSLLAYSTISQIGFILLGFAVGGRYGVVGGMLYIAAHALAKSGLFYGVGMIEDSTGRDNLDTLGHLLKISPTLGVLMALLFGSLIGFFPMIGFFAKLWVVIGAVEQTIYLGIGAIVAAVFTLLYSARFYHGLFFGKSAPKIPKIKRPSLIGLIVVLLLTLASLLSGILFYQPVNYLTGNGGF